MLFLAVTGFILMNVLGIVFLPRLTICIYIWYSLAKWGYLTNNDPGWMVLPVMLLFFGTILVLIWDVMRGISFWDDRKRIF